MKQAIAQSYQLKLALKTQEALINTLILANSKDGDEMTTRQVLNAAMLKEILDIMTTMNWCRIELKDKIKQHIKKAEERDKEITKANANTKRNDQTPDKIQWDGSC